MGSVDETYKCPLCGRIGNGGYVMDGEGIGPICTDVNNRYNCLSRLIDGATPNDIVGEALKKVLVNDFRMAYPGLAMLVAARML